MTGFPVKTLNPNLDLKTMADIEGRPFAVTLSGTWSGTGTVVANAPNGYVSYSVAANIAAPQMQCGRALVLESVSLDFNKQVRGHINIASTTAPYVASLAFPSIYWNAMNKDIKMSGILRWNGIVNPIIVKITEPLNGVTAPTVGTTATVTFDYDISLVGTYVTDDFNLTADYIQDWWGDSIAEGVGCGLQTNMFPFLIRNYFINKGYNVRLRNHSAQGSTSGQQDSLIRQSRRASFMPAQQVFILLGANDISQTVSQSVYVANINNLVDEAIRLGVKKIIVLAITPNQNVTRDNSSTAFSNAVQDSLISREGYGDNILFCPNTRIAFTATDSTKYVDGTHPNDNGNVLVANSVITWLDTTPNARII